MPKYANDVPASLIGEFKLGHSSNSVRHVRTEDGEDFYIARTKYNGPKHGKKTASKRTGRIKICSTREGAVQAANAFDVLRKAISGKDLLDTAHLMQQYAHLSRSTELSETFQEQISLHDKLQEQATPQPMTSQPLLALNQGMKWLFQKVVDSDLPLWFGVYPNSGSNANKDGLDSGVLKGPALSTSNTKTGKSSGSHNIAGDMPASSQAGILTESAKRVLGKAYTFAPDSAEVLFCMKKDAALELIKQLHCMG